MEDFKLREECGVFGIFGETKTPISKLVYYALFALQHRGQEACGIAVNNENGSRAYKNLGLVSEVFDDFTLGTLDGNMAIGHVRYSTAGGNLIENAQPLSIKYVKGTLSIAHNGQIANAIQLRRELEEQGAIFQTTSDTEVIAFLLAKERIKTSCIEEAVKNIVPKLKGSFSMLIMSPKKIIAVRDPYGIRPLAVGKVEGRYAFSSETCAFDAVSGDFVRDVRPGEIVIADRHGLREYAEMPAEKTALCIFEHVYFARPDSVIDGQGVDASRHEAGRILARQSHTVADAVIGVPDSGLSAAMGYAEESGIPYTVGLIKNRYIGRTFIQPSQNMREKSVSLKLNALAENIAGKRVIMVDDSIVRGTTTKQLINLIKRAGAKEVHLRVASAPFKYPCYFGTDVPSRDQLIANKFSTYELCKELGCNSLEFLTYENLEYIAPKSKLDFCKACFSGEYPMDLSCCGESAGSCQSKED